MSKVKSFSVRFGLFTIVVGVLFGTLPRNWVESFLRADPDGGSGMLELLIAFLLITIGAGIALYAIRLGGLRAERRPTTDDRATGFETLPSPVLGLDRTP